MRCLVARTFACWSLEKVRAFRWVRLPTCMAQRHVQLIAAKRPAALSITFKKCPVALVVTALFARQSKALVQAIFGIAITPLGKRQSRHSVRLLRSAKMGASYKGPKAMAWRAHLWRKGTTVPIAGLEALQTAILARVGVDAIWSLSRSQGALLFGLRAGGRSVSKTSR